MKLLFDATPLALRGYDRGGAYRYGIELLRHLPAALPPEWELRLYFNFFRSHHLSRMREVLERVGQSDPILSRIHPRLLRLLHVPAEWTAGRHELFHGPFDRLPPTRHSARVLTIQDLAFLRAPEGLPREWVREAARIVPLSARRAHRIVTGSAFSRLDIVERLGIPPERVSVVPHGISESLAAPSDRGAAAARLERRYGIRPGFLLYLGTLQPNKNVEGLCAAYQILRRRGFTGQLVLAGQPGWLFEPMWERIVARGDDAGVLRTGFVDEEDVPRLYGCCAACALVSFLEGFGIPALEALACEAPLVVADACSLPEVSGGAAVLVEPHSPEAIAAGLEEALREGPERERRRRLGLARARAHTWKRSAAGHVAVYREALAAHPPR